MGQQLCFDAVNAWGLLQRLNDVLGHLRFDAVRVHATRRHEQIANHTFGAFIDEEGVADDVAALDGGIAGKDFGIDVAENHVC